MDSVIAVISAMSWPRAGMFWLFPTATIAAARWSCCLFRVTVSPWAFCVVRPSGIGPDDVAAGCGRVLPEAAGRARPRTG